MADIPNRKYYAKIADPNARATYPPSVEDPQPPVTPVNPMGPDTFLELTDTPNSYAGQAGKLVGVNNAENALTFLTGVPFPDGVVVVGSAVQAGNDILYGTDWIWRINQVLYSLSSASNISFPVSASGQIRRDIVVGNASGGIVRVAGTEVLDTEPAIPPNVPANTVLLQEILITDLGIDTVSNAALATFVRFDINNQGLSQIQRANARTNIQSVSKDTGDIITIPRNQSWSFRDRDNLQNLQIEQTSQGTETLVVLRMFNQAGNQVFRVLNGVPQTGFGNDNANFYLRGSGVSSRTLVTLDDGNGDPNFSMTAAGSSIFYKSSSIQPRSSTVDRSVRRDELPFNYPQTVATIGTINDLSLTDEGVKLLILTACDELTGVVPVTTNAGRELKIESRRSGGTIIKHESASSTAANRFSLPGGIDMTINQNEIYTFIYTNGRWRRCF